MAKDPWKKLLANGKLVATRHNGFGYEWTTEDSKMIPREFTLTRSDLVNMFRKQKNRCFWFGIELNPHDVFHPMPRYPLAPSIDRLDNNEGYTIDNVVITSRLANLARGTCLVDDWTVIVKKLNFPNEQLPHNIFFDFE
jgi:hypothetical protein